MQTPRTSPIPQALRVDLAAIGATALLPLLAGGVIAMGLAAAVPAALEGRTAVEFARHLAILCYLGVAAAHVGGWIAGDLMARFRQDPADLAAQLAPPEPGACGWAAFPNPLDAALLAIALATLVNVAG